MGSDAERPPPRRVPKHTPGSPYPQWLKDQEAADDLFSGAPTMSDTDKVIEAMVEVTSPGNARGHMRRVLRAALEAVAGESVNPGILDGEDSFKAWHTLCSAAYPESQP